MSCDIRCDGLLLGSSIRDLLAMSVRSKGSRVRGRRLQPDHNVPWAAIFIASSVRA